MSPGQNNLPSKSIKEVPGRSKLRVESINPVPTGNPITKSSKVKLISPEEAIKLTSGTTQWAASPISEAPRPKLARATSTHRTPEAPRPVSAPPTSEPPKPVLAHRAPEAPRPVLVCPISEPPPRPVSAHRAPDAPRPVLVCGLRALSLNTPTVRQRKTNPSRHQAKTVEPPSPRALQIRSRVKQQAANATPVVQGTSVEVVAGDTTKDHGFKEIRQSTLGISVEVGAGDTRKDHGFKEIRESTSDQELTELLQYRPALHSTWMGRIVDSATPPEFDCDFWGKPASKTSRKAYKLLSVTPALLKVELLPTGHILDDVFGRTPSLSNVEMYLFPDEKKTERFNGEHARLFDAMATRNAMIKVPIKGTELLIFSSKLLDKTSQFLINTQKKTENFLWGFFLRTKKSVLGTSFQNDKEFDDGGVVDMDTECTIPPSLSLKLIADSQSIPSRSLEKVKIEASVPPGFEEANLPPGFEMRWTPPLVKLNIQVTSNPKSEESGLAGIVRDESGKWVFGYSRCHKGISEVSAGLVAIYHGLKLLWDSGFRKIRLETTNLEIMDALTTHTNLFPKRRSVLDRCKDLILKDWECEIYHISKEKNWCAEWLASRVEGQPQGLVFFEYPPRGLLKHLDKDSQ